MGGLRRLGRTAGTAALTDRDRPPTAQSYSFIIGTTLDATIIGERAKTAQNRLQWLG